MDFIKSDQFKHTVIYLIIGIIIGIMIGGLLWFLIRQPQGTPLILSTRAPISTVTIYVSGQVESPGVYELPFGSRVSDAIEAAGGPTTDADLSYLNLALLLSDTEHIYVPSAVESRSAEFEIININYATQEQLESLSGIGSTIAQQIIEYRTEHGLFSTIEEIQKVPGIGPSTFEKIKNHITVGN